MMVGSIKTQLYSCEVKLILAVSALFQQIKTIELSLLYPSALRVAANLPEIPKFH